MVGDHDLREALFDPDSGAQQELLRTMMLQVGADSMNYRMDRTRWRENAGENLSFTERSITLGTDTLRHYCFGIGAEKASDWTVAGPATRDDLDPNTLYYVAVKARTDRPEAEWYVSDRSCGVNDLEGYYVFQFGLLGAAAEGVRTFIETRGMSTLYGDNLTVGRIRSLDGTSYFDLTTGELCVKGDNARIDKYDFLARSFMPDDTTEVAGGVVLSNFIGVKNGGNIQAGMTRRHLPRRRGAQAGAPALRGGQQPCRRPATPSSPSRTTGSSSRAARARASASKTAGSPSATGTTCRS